MQHWIRHPSEPRELILAWQAPLSVADRVRWAIGILQPADGSGMFRYFTREEFRDYNLGRDFDKLSSLGYAGYPAFDVSKQPAGVFHEHVLEAFLRRLPPPSRTDFNDYLAYFGIEPGANLSTFSLLGITEAHLPSDGFSLVDPLDASAEVVDVKFEIAGFRHWKGPLIKLSPGDTLSFEEEPSNEWDKNAIRIKYLDSVIGYVNRLQVATVAAWMKSRNVSCWITKLNGTPEAPRAFAYMQIRPLAQAIAA